MAKAGSEDVGVFIIRVIPEGGKGEPIDVTDRIMSLMFEDNESKTDKLTLTVDNYDMTQPDEPTWRKGNFVEARWGYPGKMAPARTCVIKKIEGFEILQIECDGKAVLMDAVRKSRVWRNVTRSEVVKMIAKEHGYRDDELDVDDTKHRYPSIARTSKTSDFEFVTNLAKKLGFVFYIDAYGFHFRKRKMDQAPVKVLRWFIDQGKGEWISARFVEDSRKKKGKVSAKGRDPLSKKPVEGVGSNSTTKNVTALAHVVEVVDAKTGQTSLQTRNVREEVISTTEPTAAAAKDVADAKYAKARQVQNKFQVTIVGDPSVEAKKVLEVQGVAAKWAGKYYVKKCVTKIDAGSYTQELETIRGEHNGHKDKKKNVKTEAPVNDKKAEGDKLRQVEVVDPITGRTHIEWRK